MLRTLALEQQTAFRFKGQTEFFCARNGSKRKEHLRCSGPNINHNNRGRQLGVITVLDSPSRDEVFKWIWKTFSLRLLSHGRHAREGRHQSRNKKAIEMQIEGNSLLRKSIVKNKCLFEVANYRHSALTPSMGH